ncbi:CPBP family intramembrane metalloprotease [bacterium]|nr:CPBP family intramembrane metalloprotease [bacterium]
MLPKEPHYSAARGPWDLRSTLGLSFSIIVVYFGVQYVASQMFLAGIETQVHGRQNALFVLEAYLGLMFSIAMLAAAPVGIWLILYCIYHRRGPSPYVYLSLKGFTLRQLGVWLGLLIVMTVAGDAVTRWLGRPVQPAEMEHIWRTAVVPPLLWIAVIGAVPVFEELFFRGFLYRGIEWSRLGRDGAIVITAVCWAVSHLEYDSYNVAMVFLMGILMGYARAMTGSTLLVIVLHAANNLFATVQIYYLIGHGR